MLVTTVEFVGIDGVLAPLFMVFVLRLREGFLSDAPFYEGFRV